LSGDSYQIGKLRKIDNSNKYDLLLGPVERYKTSPTFDASTSPDDPPPELADFEKLGIKEDETNLIQILIGLFYPVVYDKIDSLYEETVNEAQKIIVARGGNESLLHEEEEEEEGKGGSRESARGGSRGDGNEGSTLKYEGSSSRSRNALVSVSTFIRPKESSTEPLLSFLSYSSPAHDRVPRRQRPACSLLRPSILPRGLRPRSTTTRNSIGSNSSRRRLDESFPTLSLLDQQSPLDLEHPSSGSRRRIIDSVDYRKSFARPQPNIGLFKRPKIAAISLHRRDSRPMVHS